ISTTFGAVILGGLFAALLCGVVIAQAVVYIKMYPKDPLKVKLLVTLVLSLDVIHTGFIWTAIWDWIVIHYGDTSSIDLIHWSVAFTIMFTAILTFCVHMFLAHRIWLLSHKNYLLTVVILFLAFSRLISATATTGGMLKYARFSTFRAHGFAWIFTLGLALSCVADILITASLFVLLHTSRSGQPHFNAVIDALILYAFENGLLTCIGTVASMICWILMGNNLIFMALHFGIGKLYANSLLATLNARRVIQ
ncbi:hypothetical protein FISHEDRAFT_13227, partial [Fistulina hepatica ATCC 64428]